MSLTGKDIKQMEADGVFDYWNDLTKFISTFIDRNYPLTNEDMKSIITDNLTNNVIKRQKAQKVMQDKLQEIITIETQTNKQFLEEIKNNPNIMGIKAMDHNLKLQQFQQEILEAHWDKIMSKQQEIVEIENTQEQLEIKDEEGFTL